MPPMMTRLVMTRIVAVLFCVVMTCSFLAAQSATKAASPCSAIQQKQLDFWVGDWDLTWPGEKSGEIAHGTNSIKRILDGCVVQENFSGVDAMSLRGTSVSTF